MTASALSKASAGETQSPAERFMGWQLIASGGVADVFKVFDRELGVSIAIKILKQVHSGDARHVAALRREVLISRKLRHPNICPIHDIYEGPHGVGIAMDLIEGQDLKAWMQVHRHQLLETIGPRLGALKILTEALAFAHSQITHRDLKPANIFLKNGDIGSPIIMDFGLSVLSEQNGASAVGGGTPKYMAPEQLVTPERVDRRADIYSLGVLAYELLTDGEIPACSLKDAAKTGELPQFDPADILAPSAFCSALPSDLDRLVLQMLEHDPEKRPQSAPEIGSVLDKVTLLDPFAAPRKHDVARSDTIAVAAGSYAVGERSANARACDQPSRRITLRSYRIGRTPVTNREYRQFLKATGYRLPALMDHRRFGDDRLPVVMVSWDDATAYAKWAGGRLPSEFEWEVAARAGSAKNAYPWGEEPPQNSQANIDGICSCPTQVGSYATGANAWGMTDTCGNVWEWCADSWDEHLLKNIAPDAANPTSHIASEERAIRGGSFDSPRECGRCGFRHHAHRNSMRPDLGFRVVYDS